MRREILNTRLSTLLQNSSRGGEILEQIEEVSIDLWVPYKTLVEELMPNAQIVADRFHVMKQVNDELDRRGVSAGESSPAEPPQRKEEKRQVKKEKNKLKVSQISASLNKSKYVLLKNESSLNESQILKLGQVKLASPRLGLMHELKEEFRNIFEKDHDWLSGLFSLGKWLNSAAQYFPSSQKTIRKWLAEIIAYFDNRLYRTCYAVLAFKLPENLARHRFQVKSKFLLAISGCNPRIATLSAKERSKQHTGNDRA